MEKKSKVVLSSVLAIAMSASLAVGGTYALFTSESKVNVAITSGKVEVVATAGGLNTYSVVPAANGTIVDEFGGKYEYVQQAAGTFKNGGRATIASENQEVLLERLTPGDKVEFALTLKNESNVAAQIRTGIYCVAGPVLYQQLNITVGGEALNTFESYTAWETWDTAVKTVNVVVEFPVTSGNEFQNLSTQIGYKIEAVQGNAVVQPWVAPTSAFNNYNAQASGNVATSTTGTAGNFTTVTSEAKTVTDTTGSVSAVIPAGTTTTAQSAAVDSLTTVKLNVQKKDDVSGANFTVNEGSSAAYVDISLKEVTESEGTVTETALTNSENPFIISMNVGKGLYNVGLQHKPADGSVETFGAVGSASEVDAHGEFYYNFATGELTLASEKFSPFAITYDTVYNASDNSATLAQIIAAAGANSTVKVDAANAGTDALAIEKNLTLVVDGTLTNAITVAAGKTLTLSAGANSAYTGNLVLKGGAKVVSAFELPASVAESLACEENADGTYTYTNPVATVTVGGVTTNYTSLAKAVAAATDGATVTLVADDTATETIAVTKNITLDLNNKTFTSTAGNGFAYKTGLTITGNGKMIHNGSNILLQATLSTSTLTIENGEFTLGGAKLLLNKGSITINGGVFSKADDVNGYVARETEGGYYYKPAVTYQWIDTATAYAAKDDTAKTITIATAEQLAMLAKEVNSGTAYQGWTVTLSEDIDLKGTVETDESVTNYVWTPIGKGGKPFKGTFDGNDKTISNLKVNGGLENSSVNNYHGLFGRTESPAIIRNFTIDNAEVSGSLYVGAAIAMAFTGSVSNVHVTGNVQLRGYWYVGGIFGNGYASVTDCSVNVEEGSLISGTGSYIGGIVGFHGEGACKIANCYSNVDIMGYSYVGGISGILHYGNTIENCTVDNVTITKTVGDTTDLSDLYGIGAIAGISVDHTSQATITNCSGTATLVYYSGEIKNGGIIGYNRDGAEANNLVLSDNNVTVTTEFKG